MLLGMDSNSTNSVCEQGENELTIFGEFASVCPLGIELQSTEKRKPPEPDILCNVAEHGQLAFEMVELVDQDRIARPMGDQSELMNSLRDARNNLPKETRSALATAWVGVKLRPQSLRKRKAVAQAVVSELTKREPAFEGEFRLNDEGTEVALADVQRRKDIAGGPHFRVLTVGHYEPIPLGAIEKKFGKKYQSTAPIELLAYYDRQHAPLDEQLDELIQFVNENIAMSLFKRVWIFNRYDHRICYPKF